MIHPVLRCRRLRCAAQSPQLCCAATGEGACWGHRGCKDSPSFVLDTVLASSPLTICAAAVPVVTQEQLITDDERDIATHDQRCINLAFN